MGEGEGQVLMCVGGCFVPGTEVDIIHPLNPPSHCAFEGGFVDLSSICLPAPECRSPGDRAQGPGSPGGK